MANEKITFMAKANKLGIDGYRTMSEDELRTAIESAQGASTPPVKGKGKPAANGSTANGTAPSKGKGKTAATAKAAPVKGKTTAKQAPAKSTARKATPAKGKAAQGTAKRPATGGAKGKATAKPAAKGKTATPKATAKPAAKRSAKQPTGRVAIDNKAVDWKAESNVGQTGKRKEVMDALRKAKGDKVKVFDALAHRAKAFYPGRPKAEAERMLVWLIGRVAYDFVFKTGQHKPGTRAAYGTSDAAQDVARREQRAATRKPARKAPARKPAARGKTPAKGKAAAKPKGKTARR